MADFEVRADQLRNVASQLNNIQRSISKVSSEANSVLRQTRGSITARIGAALQRTVVCANINNCANDMKNLSQGLSEAVQYYIAYEKNVYNKTFGKTVKVKSKSLKNKWEQFKDTISDKVKGISKAVKEKVENIKSKVKSTAQKLWEGIKDTASKTWDFVKDTAGKVKDNFVTAYNYLKDSYNEHGWVYKVVEYGKAAVSIVGNVAATAVAIASILGTGGLSTPAAVATIVYSLTGLADDITDIVNIAKGNYDDVGNVNYAKTAMAGIGSWIGEALGNEDIGEAIGTGVYYAGSLYTAFANLSNSIGKAKQVDSVKISDAFDSAKKLGAEQINIGKIMTTDINQLKLQFALLKKSQDYKPLFDFIGNMTTYNATLQKAVDFGFDASEAGIDVLNVATNGEFSSSFVDWYKNATKGNAVSNTYDSVTGAYDDTKDTFELITNLFKAYRISSKAVKAK